MSRILIVTSELTSVAGLPTGGRGVRLENLAHGLRQHGHEVIFSFSRKYLDCVTGKADGGVPPTFRQHAHDGNVDEIIAAVQPTVLLFSPWPLALEVRDPEILRQLPVVLDLPGMLTLENAYERNDPVHALHSRKIAALNRGDLFCVANPRQKYYLYPLLTMAGVDLREDPVRVVPISAGGEMPEHDEYPAPPVFVFGGVKWKWQEYGSSLHSVAEYCRKHGGRLKIFCGNFMYRAEQRHLAELAGHPAVTCSDLIDYGALREEYRQAAAAIELYLPNPERELAFTTRTMDYLYAGLPVIYSAGMYLADFISEYDAGWVIPADDPEKLTRVLDEIRLNPGVCRAKGRNAQRLAREQFASDRAAQPLAEFCASPRKLRNQATAATTAARVLTAQCELISRQQGVIDVRDRRLEQLQEQQQEQLAAGNRRDADQQREIAELRAGLAHAREHAAELGRDLGRIKGRRAFQILLRLKKVADALLQLVGWRGQV